MKWALVNGDYEFELFKQEVGPTLSERINKNRNDVEFVFFYLNKDKMLGLSSTQNYQDEYLRRLEQLGFIVPSISSQHTGIPWYGKLQDIAKEKKLNSKIWSYHLLNEMGFNPVENHFVKDRQQILRVLSSRPPSKWLLKSPYFMSGVGFTLIKDEDDIPELTHEHILEPYLERIADVSYIYDYESHETYFYLNQASPTGQYVGGSIFSNPLGLEIFLKSRNLHNAYTCFRDQALEVIDKVKVEQLQQKISFDGFLFKQDTEVLSHPLCDINYRQSMGALLLSLKHLLPKDGYGEFYILTKPPGWNTQDFMPYSLDARRGVLYLTHVNAPNLAVFICGNSVEDASTIRKKFFYHAHKT